MRCLAPKNSLRGTACDMINCRIFRLHAQAFRLTTKLCIASPRRCVFTSASAEGVLFISTVWPERSSSAAGVRTSDLIASFQQRGHPVSYLSTSTVNEHTALIQSEGVSVYECPPNNEGAFAEVIEDSRPAIVVFDRFYAEEMFSWGLRNLAPDALTVLDMQDVHFLREARRQLAKEGASMEAIVACRPDAASRTCLLRELAAMHRCDLTLVCSPVEERMLKDHYRIPEERLALAPFFSPPSPHEGSAPSYDQRRHFLMIGNFRHPPNADSVEWACSEVWPKVRQALAAAGTLAAGEEKPELHIYGSYAPQSASRFHRPKDGVHLKGFAPSLEAIMTQYRVCLAPLRFGAGLKGKVVDSWFHGLPVTTTPIGSEGMKDGADSGGSWGGLDGGTDAEGVAADATRLYSDMQLWAGCQRRGFELLQELYAKEGRLAEVHDAVYGRLKVVRDTRRADDFVAAMLWQQQMRSTEYFSRWIELKETTAKAKAPVNPL